MAGQASIRNGYDLAYSPQSSSSLPKTLSNLESEGGPLTNIYHLKESGKIVDISVRQDLLFLNSATKIPLLLDFEEGEEGVRCPFKDLVGEGPREYLESLWEALQSFIRWIDHGMYANSHIMSSDVDAYILAEILQSPRFANAVMEKIMEALPASKYDEGLKDIFRQIFNNCSSFSPLRKAYFDAAVYWKLEFGGGGKVAPKFFYGQGVLGLDPAQDGELMHSLQKHKEEFCSCRKDQQAPEERRRDNGMTLKNSLEKLCKCQTAPWDAPHHYFFKV